MYIRFCRELLINSVFLTIFDKKCTKNLFNSWILNKNCVYKDLWIARTCKNDFSFISNYIILLWSGRVPFCQYWRCSEKVQYLKWSYFNEHSKAISLLSVHYCEIYSKLYKKFASVFSSTSSWCVTTVWNMRLTLIFIFDAYIKTAV